MDVISNFCRALRAQSRRKLSIRRVPLAECKRNPLAYATAAGAHAQGDRRAPDSRHAQRHRGMSRLFANKVIKIYPAFAEFYGMEDAIEQVVGYFRHAAQGLEERTDPLSARPGRRRQSSIAERLKQLMEHVPFYVIKASPVNVAARPVRPDRGRPAAGKEYGIPARYLNRIMCPWAVKRLEEFGGDIRSSRSSSATRAC